MKTVSFPLWFHCVRVILKESVEVHILLHQPAINYLTYYEFSTTFWVSWFVSHLELFPKCRSLSLNQSSLVTETFIFLPFPIFLMHQCSAFVAPWNIQPLLVPASSSVLTEGLPHVGRYVWFYQYCWFQTSHAWDSSHSDNLKHSPSTCTIYFGLGEVMGAVLAIPTGSSFTKRGHADILILRGLLMLSWDKLKHLKSPEWTSKEVLCKSSSLTLYLLPVETHLSNFSRWSC